MAERPDLDYWIPCLDEAVAGRAIHAVRVKKPIVVRLAVPGRAEDLLVAQTIRGVRRRGHFVVFDLIGSESLAIVVSPMLAGRFSIAAAGETKSPGDLAVALLLEDGRELRYRDDVSMGKFYVAAADRLEALPGFSQIGVDVLNRRLFTHAVFRALARQRRDQAKVFLMDKAALDSFGNAYADEALWEARLHPKTLVRKLPDADLDRLPDALVAVLSNANKEIARRKPAPDMKLRDFLEVRGRHGHPCPRCGSTIRSAGVHGHDADFCPACQPDARGSTLVDWRKLPR